MHVLKSGRGDSRGELAQEQRRATVPLHLSCRLFKLPWLYFVCSAFPDPRLDFALFFCFWLSNSFSERRKHFFAPHSLPAAPKAGIIQKQSWEVMENHHRRHRPL